MAGELPPGFTLDAPAAPTGLPPGFTLDAPAPKRRKNWRDDLADVVELARPGAIGHKINEGFERAGYNTGAAVNDVAAKVFPPEIAAGLGTAANVGVQSLPMMLGGAIGRTAQPAFERVGEGMMQKALRPTWESLRSGKAQSAGRTMLEEGLNPTRSGVEKLSAGADRNVAMAEALVAGSKGSIDKVPVVNRAVIPLLSKVEKQGSDDAIRTVLKTGDDFLNKDLLQGGRDIPVQLAQELKQGIYRQIGDAGYGTGLKPSAERDALKAIAHELRGGIERIVPEVAPLNAKASELINAKKIAERRVLMGGNNNFLPLGASVATAVNNPAAALGLWANSSDLVKSLLARALYSGQIPANAGRGAGLAYALQQDQEARQ